MATEIVGTPFVLNTTEVVIQANIIIDDTSDWTILPVGPNEMVCSSFEGFSVPLYECLFTRLGMCLPISDCKVDVMNHLKVSPS